jgi:hypothetical protein
MSRQVNNDKHHFTTKGKNAEQVLSDLAQQTFLTNWCFLNPHLPNGKELCDLLIIFDDIVIIWQVKDLKLDNMGKANSREVKKNLRQIFGAKRQLFDINTPIELYNTRRKREVFDSSSINEVHLISALMGEEGEGINIAEVFKNHFIHVFTKSFLPVLLEELDTIRDFCQYLAARETLVSEKRVGKIIGSEQDLLAYYLMHDRSFGSTGNVIDISKGLWTQFRNSSAYQRKKDANTISYYWDAIINRVHEARDNPPFPESMEIVARLMAWPNRLYRRMLGESFAEAHAFADSIPPTMKKDLVHRRTVLTSFGVTYCFLFHDISLDDKFSRETRHLMLQALCHVVRGLYQQNKTVIGIGTEMTIQEEDSFDFVGLQYSVWTYEDEKKLESYQKTYSFLSDIQVSVHQEEEYPSETT